MEIFEEFLNVKAIYLNKEQKKNVSHKKSSSKYDDTEEESATLSVIRKVLYKYSKAAMEEFFENEKLNNLFCFFSEDIKDIGHQTS
jgi:hypothetical protein